MSEQQPIDPSGNPARVLRELLNDPHIKAGVCHDLGVPVDTELDEEAFDAMEKWLDSPAGET